MLYFRPIFTTLASVLSSLFQILEAEVAVLDAIISPAMYQSEGSVICTLPNITEFTISTAQTEFVAIHYQLSVSNDGINFGIPVNHVVYDGGSRNCLHCEDVTNPGSPEGCEIQVRRSLQ